MNTRNLKKNVPPYIRSTFSGTPAARQFIYQWDCPHFVRPSVCNAISSSSFWCFFCLIICVLYLARAAQKIRMIGHFLSRGRSKTLFPICLH